MLYVFNKIDVLDEEELQDARLRNYEPHVLVSAKTKDGLKPLIEYLRNWKPDQDLEL